MLEGYTHYVEYAICLWTLRMTGELNDNFIFGYFFAFMEYKVLFLFIYIYIYWYHVLAIGTNSRVSLESRTCFWHRAAMKYGQDRNATTNNNPFVYLPITRAIIFDMRSAI